MVYRIHRTLILALFLSFSYKNSQAQTPNPPFNTAYTVGGLLRQCDNLNPLNIAYCMGVMDGSGTLAIILAQQGRAKELCYTDEVTFEQLRLVFIKWAKDHPEKLHSSASFGVVEALTTSFPCPNK
jgi:Rap1a immunity proteins